jgi:hypothetical protein
VVDELPGEGDTAAHIEAEGERGSDWNRVFHLDKWCTSLLVHVKR